MSPLAYKEGLLCRYQEVTLLKKNKPLKEKNILQGRCKERVSESGLGSCQVGKNKQPELVPPSPDTCKKCHATNSPAT